MANYQLKICIVLIIHHYSQPQSIKKRFTQPLHLAFINQRCFYPYFSRVHYNLSTSVAFPQQTTINRYAKQQTGAINNISKSRLLQGQIFSSEEMFI